MPYLLILHSRHALRAGRQVIGTTPDADIRIEMPDHVGRVAAIEVAAGGLARLSRLAQSIEVTVDGHALGDAPVALAHGAKVSIGGTRIVFGEDEASGSTEKRAGVPDDDHTPLDEPLPAEPTTDTGGRLVSLADGREWAIPPEGLEIGRDPNCDLVLRSTGASRWHASVAPSLLGYVLRDSSTNGVQVNGRRIHEQRVLGRGDVIRIDDEEFRFEADAAKYEPSTSLRLAAMRDGSPPSSGDLDGDRADGSPNEPDSPGVSRGRSTRVPADAVAAPRDAAASAPALLATLEVIGSGMLGGRRFRIEHRLVHVGRATHNEIVLGDESVSGSHATLQRRDDGWVVADQGSTNGTYVDGERVERPRVLRGACEIRFGGIKTIFRPLAGAPAPGDSTRGIVGVAYGADE